MESCTRTCGTLQCRQQQQAHTHEPGLLEQQKRGQTVGMESSTRTCGTLQENSTKQRVKQRD
jgi:hypothetical protein